MRRAGATCAWVILAVLSIWAAPSPPAPVLVHLKGGRELKALRVRTVPEGLLEMDLQAGGVQRIPLAEIASIRFGRMDQEQVRLNLEKYRDMLGSIRKNPFAGRLYASLLAPGRDLKQAEKVVADRLAEKRGPRQALNLAALCFRRGDLPSCKNALRLAKDYAAGDGDVDRLDEACILLAVLQLPETVTMDDDESWRACDLELIANLKEDDGETLKARLKTVEVMAAR